MSRNKQTKKQTFCVLIMFTIFFMFTACSLEKEGLQEPVTDMSGFSDMESVQVEATDRQEGELMQEFDFSVFSNVELIGADLSAMSGEQRSEEHTSELQSQR